MAKNRIGSVHVSLSASTQQFKKDMEKAKATVGGFGGFVSKATGFLNPMTAGITALAGSAAAAVGSFMTLRTAVSGFISSAEKLDSLAKTSDRLGMATEKLAGLRYAAGLSGASMETLDKGLTNMSRRLSEAAGGSGEAKASLDYLGLSAQRLASMAPDKAFYTLADAINRVGSQSKKTELAFDLFGRSGTDLMNTLAAGSSGLAAMQQEAERLGIAMSREAAAGAEQALDSFTRLGAVTEGVFMKLSAAAAPAVAATFGMVTDGAKNAVSQVADLGSQFDKLAASIMEGARGIGLLIGSIKSTGFALTSLADSVGLPTEAGFEKKRAAHEAWMVKMEQWRPGDSLRNRLSDIRGQMKTAGNLQQAPIGGSPWDFIDQRVHIKRMPQQPNAALEAWNATQAAAAARIRDGLKSPMQRLNEEVGHIRSLWSMGHLGFGEADAAIRGKRADFLDGLGVGSSSPRGGGPVAAQAFGSQGFASALAAAMNRPQNPEVAETRRTNRILQEIREELRREEKEAWLNLQ